MSKHQELIDDISDLLQGRNSEHRKYPYGHPGYRPPEGSPLPYIPGLGSRVIVDFATEEEAKNFSQLFSGLGADARNRTLEHLKEIGKVENGV